MKKVFIVEDDEIIASQVAKHLETWQMKAKAAEDFQNIMAEFEEFKPDIVLMDLKLPAYNGFYWCGEIRKVSQVPIVFLSSADENMNIVMAMNMGADDFISKPFDLQVLTAKIQAVLRRSYGESISVHELEVKNVRLNLDDTSVSAGDNRLELTKNEMIPQTPYCVVYGSDTDVRDEMEAAMTRNIGYPPAYYFQIGAEVSVNSGPKVVGVIFKSQKK